ncbi:MAG TPA: hypothetical protein VGW40_04495 [Allosphingosinicella sp.]|nr:hypothetical protein [Allosphingosinicella sp.]
MAGITIDDIERSERVRAVTDNFFFWQGRRFIALGPVLIVAAFVTNARIDERLTKGLLIAATVLALIVSARIGRRYRAEFGSVRPIPGAHALRSRIKWLLVYPAMFASLALDSLYPQALPVFLSGFVWAVGLVLYRKSTGQGRVHYLTLAACLAGLGLVPLATAITGRELVSVMLLVLGAGYTAAVLLDDDEMRAVMKGA